MAPTFSILPTAASGHTSIGSRSLITFAMNPSQIIMGSSIPELCLEIIKDRYPLSVWTRDAKQALAAREQELLRKYAEKGETIPGAVTKSGAKIIGFLLLALAGSAVGVVLVLRPGWVLKVIGVCIFLAVWEKFIETVRDSGEDISDARVNKEIAADFRSAFDRSFVIVDGPIQKRAMDLCLLG